MNSKVAHTSPRTSYSRAVVLCVLAIALLVSEAVAGTGTIWKALKPIANEYIVVLSDQNHSDIDNVVASLAASHGGSVLAILKNGVKGFGVRLSPAQAAALASDPLVDHVEENGEVDPPAVAAATGAPYRFVGSLRGAPVPDSVPVTCGWQGSYFLCDYGSDTTFWHLDRIDNRGPLYDYHAYAFNSTGASVRVYVLGTGVLATHEQFDGRVEAGQTYGDGLPASNPCGQFGDFYGPGHETSVASIIAGNTNGVAKNATIVPVKVWNCDPNNPYNGYFANTPSSILWWCYALDWILGDMRNHSGARGVVNISGGITLPNNNLCDGVQCIPAFENNVNNLLGEGLGIPVVAAANNFNNDHCDTTPARMGYGGTAGYYTPHHTVTVGGSNEQDQRWIRLPGEMIQGHPKMPTQILALVSIFTRQPSTFRI